MNRVVVIQHCQSEHHINDLTGGWTDTPLTELGRRQAACVAERLRDELGASPCPLYASDLARTWQTAGLVGEALGVAPIAEPGLREWNLGAATGKTQEWADANVNRDDTRLFDVVLFPGAESWREFHARTRRTMLDLDEREAGAVIVVTHGGASSNIVSWWLDLELDALSERTPFTGSPGGISVLVTNPNGKRVIERLNDRTHLQRASLGGGLQL